jgi:hypothetical protein
MIYQYNLQRDAERCENNIKAQLHAEHEVNLKRVNTPGLQVALYRLRKQGISVKYCGIEVVEGSRLLKYHITR